MKICSKCKKELPLDNFYPNRRMKSGKQSSCKSCSRIWHHEHKDYVKLKNANYKKENPNYHRNWQRKKEYGLSPEQINKIRINQNGLCAGCLVDLNKTKECVDHNHVTGKVRGLLCDDCNLALGRLKDNIDTMKHLIDYLIRSEAEAYT